MDNLIKLIAIVLGAKYFKKYWVVEGSYWNRLQGKKTLDKSSRKELEYVIRDAYNYTRQHLHAMVVEFLVIGTSLFLVKDLPEYTKFSYGVLLTIHLYALLMHQYNRITARECLSKLAPKDETDHCKLDIREHGGWYSVEFSGTYMKVAPSLPTRKLAQQLLDELNKEAEYVSEIEYAKLIMRMKVLGQIEKIYLRIME